MSKEKKTLNNGKTIPWISDAALHSILSETSRRIGALEERTKMQEMYIRRLESQNHELVGQTIKLKKQMRKVKERVKQDKQAIGFLLAMHDPDSCINSGICNCDCEADDEDEIDGPDPCEECVPDCDGRCMSCIDCPCDHRSPEAQKKAAEAAAAKETEEAEEACWEVAEAPKEEKGKDDSVKSDKKSDKK